MLNDFYRDTLPGSGHYALFRGDNKAHEWASTLEDLVAATERLLHVPDLYFATASYREAGDRYGGRTQANVLALRSLRLDIDAGEDKFARGKTPYRTQRDAIEALRGFIQSSQVVPTYIISSGAGLHIYYCLNEDVTPEAWLPVAAQLQSAALAGGLAVDQTVSTDTARVLRPIGSIHGKTGKAVTVIKHTGKLYCLADLSAALPEALPPAMPPKAARFDMSVNDDVAPTYIPAPRSIVKIIGECAAIRHTAKHQDQTPEPMWRAMLGVVKFTIEGRAAAHRMSNRHPDYDEAVTDEKFDRWGAGPATCAEFHKDFAGCTDCKHYGKIRSPIVLGELDKAEVEVNPVAQAAVEAAIPKPVPSGDPWDGKLPEPCKDRTYFVVQTASGPKLFCYVPMVSINEAGSKVENIVSVPVSSMFWFESWAQANNTDDRAAAVFRAVVGGNPVTYEFDQSAAATPQSMKGFLAGKAIHPGSHKLSEMLLMDYTRQALERLKAGGQRPKISDRFGLRIQNDGTMVCAQGKYVIYPDGTIREAMLASSLRNQANWFPITALPESYSSEWGLEAWAPIKAAAKQHVDFMRTYYRIPGMEPYQLAIMLGIASPLMAFVTGEYSQGPALPPTGLSVSLYSRAPGRGKTTAIRMAMTAFGNPDELVREGDKEGTTPTARLSRLSWSGTMPVSFDEMGRADAQSLTSLISAVANGAARDRSGQYGGSVLAARWALINLMSGNRQQRDMVASAHEESAAIQMRLLELDITKVPDLPPGMMRSFTDDYAAVKKVACGALGAMVHLAICRMGQAKMNALVTTEVSRAATLVGYNQEARFQWRGLGAVLALQKLLTAMGLAVFDEDALVQCFREAYSQTSDFIVQNSLPLGGVDLLQRALNDLMPRALVTHTMRKGGITGSRGHDLVLNLGGRIPDDPSMRYVVSENKIYLQAEALKAWCASKKVSPSEIIGACRERGVIEDVNGKVWARRDLFAGLSTEGVARSYVYTIDARRLPDVTHELVSGDNVVQFRTPEGMPRPGAESPSEESA